MCRVCRAVVANTFNSGRQRQADSLFEARLGYRVPGKLQRNPVWGWGEGGEGFPRNTHNFFYRLRKLQTTSPLAREPSRMSKCQSSRMQACSARSPTVLVSLQLLSLATTIRTAIFRNSFSLFYPKANSSNSFATLRSRGQTSLSSSPPPPRSVHGFRLRKCLCIFGDDTFCTPKPDSDSEAPFPATVI